MKFTVKPLDETNIDHIYSLCLSNPFYYECLHQTCTKEMIIEDLHALPPGKALKDKYFLGYFKENQLIAVMDSIEGYPTKEDMYIGFFMVDSKYQKKGIGQTIIQEFIDSCQDYNSIQLAWLIDNKKVASFWKKLGFKEIKRTFSIDHKEVISAKLELKTRKE